MSQLAINIITEQNHIANDMAGIIGRYRGSMEIFSEELLSLKDSTEDKFIKTHLDYLAKRMKNIIAENEVLWAKRGQRGEN